MMAEKYNLICRGELEPGFEQAAVLEQAAELFKIDETKARRLFTNKPQIVARKLTWAKAVKYQQMLKEIGLLTFLDAVLDAEIFRESLIPTSHQDGPKSNTTITQQKEEKSSEPELQLINFETTKLIPTIFDRAHSETLVDKNNEPVFLLKSHNHCINQIFLLLLSLPVAFIVQNYLGKLLVDTVPGSILTPLLIVVFFLIIIFLPTAMMPRRIFTLRQSKGDSYFLLCTEIPSLNPMVDSYNIFSSDNNFLATVRYSRLEDKIECRDTNNSLLYSSSNEQNADKVTKNMAAGIRDELFDFDYFFYFKIVLKQLKKIRVWSRQERPDIQRDEMLVVRDHLANKVAYFHRTNIGIIEYPAHPGEEDKDKTLIAFLLICLGVA